jgi:hypothetical protein
MMIPITYLKYKQVGHTCEQTWRIAMTVAAVLELMKDDPDSVHAHTYDTEAADMGLDPWHLIDGINPLVNQPKAELWFDSGGSTIVDLSEVVYVQQPKTARAAQTIAKTYALAFAQGRFTIKELAEKIVSGLPASSVAYVALGVASYLPDEFELQLRQALLRQIALQ